MVTVKRTVLEIPDVIVLYAKGPMARTPEREGVKSREALLRVCVLVKMIVVA